MEIIFLVDYLAEGKKIDVTKYFVIFHPDVDTKVQKNNNTRYSIAIAIRNLWNIIAVSIPSK